MAVYDQLFDSGKVTHKTEFALKLSVNRTSVTNFLNNEREPGMRFLKALHNTFKVDINWLITGAGNPFLDDEFSLEMKALDRVQRSRLLIQTQYIELEDKELITLKNYILQQDLDHEKKIILELRCEGLLRNFQVLRNYSLQIQLIMLGLMVSSWISTKVAISESLSNFLAYIGTNTHIDPMYRGLIRTSDVVYFACFTLLFLVLASSTLDKKEWK